MGTGWRRAFCTTIPRDTQETTSSSLDNNNNKNHYVVHEQQLQEDHMISPAPTPRSLSKLGAIFSGGLSSSSSNPSTPRLRVKTTTRSSSFTSSTAATPVKKDATPKLRCKTMPNTPTSKSYKPPAHLSSNPSSPRSPFSIFKNSLRLSRNNCGVCMQSVKSGQKTAIFTSECSHSFHFPCISNHLRNQNSLFCPVCNTTWKDALPLLSINQPQQHQQPQPEKNNVIIRTPTFNDDEPLLSTASSINSIPEVLENDDEIEEFKGFLVNPVSSSISINNAQVETRLLPEVAIVSTCQTHETYVVVLKIKAPPPRVNGVAQARRAPIDLVSVLDIGGSMTRTKLDMMKRAMHLVVSSLGSADRLSIIAFSATVKRLMPLKRMTCQGQRSARRVIDRLDLHNGSCAGDALRQATKILEDRRERNPVASVMLLSDGQDEPQHDNNTNNRHVANHGSSTRFAHVEIPVQSSGYSHEPTEDAFAKCVGGLLSVVVQDLRIQVGLASGSDPAEICAVYPSNRPLVFSSGLVRIGDLYAEEERELLLELRVPITSNEGHHVLSVCCSYKDPTTQEIIYGTDQPLLVPKPQPFRSSLPKIQRLRNFFVTTRAIAESRRLIALNEMCSAVQLLASSRELLVQSGCLGEEYVRRLETELLEIRWRKEAEEEMMQRRQRMVEEKEEPLTPSSAWRRSKVSCVKTSTKRVSDLHGFENARF